MVYELGNFTPLFTNEEAKALWGPRKRHSLDLRLFFPQHWELCIFRMKTEKSILEMIDVCATWAGICVWVLGGWGGQCLAKLQARSGTSSQNTSDTISYYKKRHGLEWKMLQCRMQNVHAFLMEKPRPWKQFFAVLGCLSSPHIGPALGLLGWKICRNTHVSASPGPSGPCPLFQLYVVKRNFLTL